MISNQEQIQKRFELYMNDWNLYAKEWLKVDLDPEQQEVLRAIQTSPKVAVASGTSRGKDFIGAVAGICFLYLTPRFDDKGKMIANSKVACTAPTERQVKNIMTPEITRIFNQSVYLHGYLTGNDIRTSMKEWFLTGFKADDTNVEAWSGFHAANVMYIVTEASGMADAVFDAIEGNLQGNSRLLVISNANINTGYFANAMKSPQFKKFRLNSLNATNVKAKKVVIPGQVDYIWVKGRVLDWCTLIRKEEISTIEGDFEFEGKWYRPNDLFRIKVLGRFPKVSEGVLVPQEWIELANERWKIGTHDSTLDRQGNKGTTAEVIMATKPLRLGNDIAGMGRDSTCWVYRYDKFVQKIEMLQSAGEANHMEALGATINILKANTKSFSNLYPQAFIDTIGEGAAVYSRAREINEEYKAKNQQPIYVHSVKFSEGAYHNGSTLKDMTGQYEFLNMRAYLYWAIRDWLDPKNKTEAMLPDDPELLQELTETKWKFRSDGKIQIEEKEEIKKRIKRSPDKADALANTFYPEKDIDPHPAAQTPIEEYFF